jgi:hypothetical protein
MTTPADISTPRKKLLKRISVRDPEVKTNAVTPSLEKPSDEEKQKRAEYYAAKRKQKVHIDYIRKRLPIEEAKVNRYKQEIAEYEAKKGSSDEEGATEPVVVDPYVAPITEEPTQEKSEPVTSVLTVTELVPDNICSETPPEQTTQETPPQPVAKPRKVVWRSLTQLKNKK